MRTRACQVDETRVDIEVACRLSATGVNAGFDSLLRYSLFGDGTIRLEHTVKSRLCAADAASNRDYNYPARDVRYIEMVR
jgi:hypothetical protein